MIRVTILVNDIDTIIQLYTHIRLYYSDSESGTYTHLAYVALVPSQTTYTYDDITGTPDTWYKFSYWSASGESSTSSADHGDAPELYHWPTYPDEFDFSTDNQTVIRKIRRYVGDFKSLRRLYINDSDAICQYVHDDGKTVNIGEKGWPVYIGVTVFSSIDDTTGTVYSKTSADDPVVQGYQYLTFSGTLNAGDKDDIIDIWYYHFTFSDREMYEAYGDAMIPPGLTSSTVTQDHLILQASIDLLENLSSDDMVNDGASVRDDNSTYDPSPGLAERDKTLKRLRGVLGELTKQYKFSDITGVLID